MRRIYKEVDWSISFIGFLLYFTVVITQQFEGGSLAIAAAVGGLLIEKGHRRFPYWLTWFLVFMLWGVVSYTQSPYAEVAWNDGVIEYAKLWLICMVAVNVLTNGARIRFFLAFFLFLYMTHPIRGALFNAFIYGYTEGGRTVWNAAWRNPNDMAALTFLPLGLAAGFLKDRNDWVRKAALVSVSLCALVIAMTQSRGGLVGLALFAMLTVFANRRQIKGLLGVVVVAVVVIVFAPAGTFDRFGDLTAAVRGGNVAGVEDDRSAEQRLEIWRIARRVLGDHRVFGVGLAAYPRAHGTYSFMSAETVIGGGRRDAHNTYLRVAAETGFPGLMLYFTPFLFAVLRSRRFRRKYEKQFPDKAEGVKYVEVALLALAVCAIFGSYAHTIFLWIHLALLAILTEDLRRTGSLARRPAFGRGPPPGALARRPRSVRVAT